MKILFINNFFSAYGGAEKSIQNQARLLIKHGNKVEFFSTNKQPYLQNSYHLKNFFPRYTDYKQLRKLDMIKNLPEIFYNKESETKLLSLIKVIKPDVVHCHNIYYYLTPSVISACKQAEIPVVMTLHDPRLFCPGGTMMYKASSYCDKEHCIKGNPIHGLIHKCRNSSLKESFVSVLEYSANRFAGLYDYVSLFICPSAAMYNLAAKSGISQQRLTVLNNFIEDSLFTQLPVYTNKGYFLYIGRLAKEKGVHTLIEAAKFLPKNINFHIVGNGPEEENLRRQASLNIKFKGYLDGYKLRKEYSGCIATILPCNWFEVFGLTIAESFAYGKPVIASRIGAIPELITEDADGLMFEPGNSEQLSQAIYKLYKETDLPPLMGKRARIKAESLFNSDLHYKNLIKIYNSV